MNEEMSPKDNKEPQQAGNQSSAPVTITEEDLLEAENDLQGGWSEFW